MWWIFSTLLLAVNEAIVIVIIHPLYLWFLSGFPWYRVAASNEATELRVSFGKVESCTVSTMTWLTAMEYLCHKISTSRSFPYSWLITRFVTRWTRQVSLVERELLTLLEHECSPMVFIGVRITRFLVLCVYFVDRFLSFVLFLLAIVFSVLLRYLQTLLNVVININEETHCVHTVIQYISYRCLHAVI
jgi:hypothetical protein